LKASQHKIKKLLYTIRQELYPAEKGIILSKPYIATKGDFNIGGGVSLCRFRGLIVDTKDHQNEVIIFSSPCLLQLLIQENWFVDGTFKICARGYRQLLIIITYHSSFKSYLPACYILMSHKSYACYQFAFKNLVLIYHAMGYKVKPKYIMCDFEAALRKGLQEYFPSAKIAGCYFHYCKAIWNYMASNGFTSKEMIFNTTKLVTFLKILVHIEAEKDRQEFFKGLKILFSKKDKKYGDVFKYFEKVWLKSYFVEPLKINDDEEFDLIARTNNTCEYYNYSLNQKLKITNPRLSILVTCLLNEEQNIREFISKRTISLDANPPIPKGFVVRDDELPIGSLTKILDEKKRDPTYNLRSLPSRQDQDKEFLIGVQKLVEKCYQTIFYLLLKIRIKSLKMDLKKVRRSTEIIIIILTMISPIW